LLCAGRSPWLKSEYTTLLYEVKYESLIQPDGGEPTEGDAGNPYDGVVVLVSEVIIGLAEKVLKS